NGFNRGQLYEELLAVAQKKTREADTKLDKHGKRVTDEAELNSDNVLIVETPLLAGEGLSTGGVATGKGQVHDTEAVRSLKKKGAPRAPRTKREKTKRTKR
ncbi:MAG: hypothetical protein ACK53V_18350, partial [Planctomycetota bacterium]